MIFTNGLGQSVLRITAILSVCLGGFSESAHAVDGCKVLVCLGGNWSNIAVCKPDVEEALRDAALGRGFPSCQTEGSNGIEANNLRLATVDTCPPFYANYGGDDDTFNSCAFNYIVSISIDGQPFSDLFFNASGPTSTRYYDAARTALGSNIDPRYDNDAAAYAASHPATPPVYDGGGDGGGGS